MLSKSVESGSWLPESCSSEVNCFWGKQQSVGIWTVFPLWNLSEQSVVSALAQPPWRPKPSEAWIPHLVLRQAAVGRLEFVGRSEPYNGPAAVECCYKTPTGPGPHGHPVYLEQRGQSLLHYLLTSQQVASRKVSKSSLRTNGEILSSSAALTG